LSRWNFIFAKLLALMVVFAASVTMAALGTYYYTLFLFEPMPVAPWLALNGLLLVYALVFVALTLFFSTLVRSQALAGGLSLAALAIMGVLGSFPGAGEYMPGHLAGWGITLMARAEGAAWPALWFSLGLILASLTGAWLVLRKQEL
jgi:hypothetical protein